jgi:EpsD family peptidyl-prolyl cis-trans isomerase
MKSRYSIALLAVACAGLISCGGKGEPKGQVVARVGKEEVTVLDLQSEMGGFQAPNAQVRKAAEQQVLTGIVERKLLAQAARKEKLDKTPEYARARQKADEALLVKTWEENLARAVPAPSPEEVQKFINEHPDLYAERKRISIVGVRFLPPTDKSVFQALQPLNTLPEVTALLTARNIPYKDAAGEIDALSVDPRFVDQLLKLKPDAVFVVPQSGAILVGRISGVRVDAVPPAIAKQHATNFIRSTRTREALTRRLAPVVQAGLKDVKYNKDYAPPPKPATPAAKAPAPAAAPVVAPAASPAAAPKPAPAAP